MKKKKKKNKKDKNEDKEEEEVDDIVSEVRNLSDEEDIDSEEADFWMPSVGERWDFDDGGDRWCSGSESGQESDDVNAMGMFCLNQTQIIFLCHL